MSEEQPKITTVEKVKDPRRVAQGKRLAAISREAKAKKKQKRLEQQQQEEESGNLSYLLPVVIVGGVIATVRCYCYSKKKKEEPTDAIKKEELQSNTINRPSRIENF